MKKLISIILTVLLAVSAAVMLTGCDRPSAQIRSVMNVDPSFRGTRTVTVVYPLSTDIDLIKDAIMEGDPSGGVEGLSFAYKGVEEDGYYFELSFEFADRSEYEAQASAAVGRSATALLSVKDTVITTGVRMAENFDVSDLVGWMTRATETEEATKDLGFECTLNTVTVGSKTYTEGSTVDISDVKGSTVSSVSIRTSNDKQGRYDRTFVFTVPNSVYLTSKDSFESYFLANTAPAAGYCGWSSEGANMLYTVIYEDLSVKELREYTAMLLDTDSVEIDYGDSDSTSTPLSEGMVFTESLDTFSFIGADKGAPTLQYSYSLPVSTIHGDGAVYKDGTWVTEGKWEEGVYKAELSSGSVELRIPDGMQYAINGVDFYLESLGDGRFRRTTSFLYSKTDGYDGMNYAESFFTSRGAKAVTGEDEDNLICSLVSEGTAAQITDELVKMFGSGNFMAWRSSTSPLALSVKTEFVDYVSLSSILSSSNANRPMRYRVSSASDENIVSLFADGAEQAYKSASESVLEVKGGSGVVEYKGNIPITVNIIIYVLTGAALTFAAILTAVLLLRRGKKRGNTPDARCADGTTEPDAPADLSQTTTFSISELTSRRNDIGGEAPDVDIPDAPDTPGEPETPEEPDAPDSPEEPDSSEKPDEPADDGPAPEEITVMLEEAREALEQQPDDEPDPDGEHPDPIALLDAEDDDV